MNRYFFFDTNTEIIANLDQIRLKKLLKSFKLLSENFSETDSY